jgi:hypothetical protein
MQQLWWRETDTPNGRFATKLNTTVIAWHFLTTEYCSGQHDYGEKHDRVRWQQENTAGAGLDSNPIEKNR